MLVEFRGDLAASATDIGAGYLVLVSRTGKSSASLLFAQVIDIKGSVKDYLLAQLKVGKAVSAIDVVVFRTNVSPNWGSIMSEHIYQLFEHSSFQKAQDKVARTAQCYELLISWGESSAAREIALRSSTPVRTVQNRLRLARARGILKSPGQGSRRGS